MNYGELTMEKIICQHKECNKEATIEVNNTYFCTPHYEEYYYKQPRGVLNWKGVHQG